MRNPEYITRRVLALFDAAHRRVVDAAHSEREFDLEVQCALEPVTGQEGKCYHAEIWVRVRPLNQGVTNYDSEGGE